MIALPFVYFICMLIVSFRKHGFDVGTYVILLFTIISFCSILVDVFGFYSKSCIEMPLGVVAPILYCILLTICLWPFYKFNSNSIKRFGLPKNLWIFDIVVYFYFFIFLIILFVSLTRIQEVFISNLAEVRNLLYLKETASFYDHLHGLPRMICAVCSILAPSSFIMILFFFYSVAFLNKSFIFNLMILLGSLSPLPISINIADRSQFVYWMLLCGLSFTLFYKHFTKRAWGFVRYLMIFLFSIFVIYLLLVTVSRFGEREDGMHGGIILYAGQSYINFCNFFNYLNHDFMSLAEIFPFTYRYILNEPTYFEICEKIHLTTKMPISVFSTFLGIILSISGLFVTVLYCFFYRFFCYLCLTRSSVELSFDKLIKFWIVVLVPVLGLFGSFYAFPNATIAILVWLLISLFIQKKIIIK